MAKFIAYNKLSKRKQRQVNAAKRGKWGDISPITRRSASPKAYKREKIRPWSDDDSGAGFFYYISNNHTRREQDVRPTICPKISA